MKELRFAIFGTGFWARYQLAGWRELPGARCVALYNRTRKKAEQLAREFGVPSVYDDPEKLFSEEQIDFIDVITDVGTHSHFVHLAAKCGVAVICQKPMAETLADAEKMVKTCQAAGIPFFVHENWRWQRPIRELAAVIRQGKIGRPFRARIDFCSSFPVFENQPFLKELDQFILSDIGSHILDVARFLFGEAETLTCQTHRIHSDIKGEDVATVLMKMKSGATVVCNMSYASRLEQERFPETFILVEGETGSVELAPDYWIRHTNSAGTLSRRCPPPFYAWTDPRYALVQSSIVDCHANLLEALQNGSVPETSAADNLNTVRLVFASYEAASKNQTIQIHPN